MVAAYCSLLLFNVAPFFFRVLFLAEGRFGRCWDFCCDCAFCFHLGGDAVYAGFAVTVLPDSPLERRCLSTFVAFESVIKVRQGGIYGGRLLQG